MFNINFYTFTKKNNSTKRPTGTGTSLTCNMKTESDILAPSIEVNHTNPTAFNYCYIQEFGRYYFITDWTYNSPFWTASCSVDVLASYKTDISNSSLYVLRSASDYDLYEMENMYGATSYYTYETVKCSNFTPKMYSNGSVVVGILGSNPILTTGGDIVYYQMTPALYQELITNLFVSADGVQWGDLVQGAKNALFNPLQYIFSVRWYPFAFPTKGSTGTNLIRCGYWTATLSDSIYRLNGDILTGGYENFYTVSIPKHPKSSTRGQWLNLSPFTKYTLCDYRIGAIDLPSQELVDCNTIVVYEKIDFNTGVSSLQIYALNTRYPHILETKEGVLLCNTEYQCGVNIPIIADQSGNGALNIISGFSQLTSSMLSFYSNTEENPMADTEYSDQLQYDNYTGLRKATIGAIQMISPTLSAKGNIGSLIQHQNYPFLYCVFYDPVDEDLTNLGRPLNEVKTIGTLSGFTLCKTGLINTNATEPEKRRICQYLTSGFYYE